MNDPIPFLRSFGTHPRFATSVLWLVLCAAAPLVAGADAVISNVVAFSTGTAPSAALVQALDGSLYGVTRQGGDSNKGSIFMISPDGTFSPLYSFGGRGDGAFPYAALIQADDGWLYGTAPNGGIGNLGTLFRISTNGEFDVLHAFTGSDGANPYGSLVQGGDGRFYGTTAAGGSAGLGTIFRAGTNGNVFTLHSFTGVNEGSYPYAGLMLASDGNFYGTTVLGGANPANGFNLGTVFRFGPAGLTTMHTFAGDDGAYPFSPLTQGRDGLLYGTSSGVQPNVGISSYGTVYRMALNGALTNIYSFSGGADGANPYSTLWQASDGFIYGTSTGGTNNDGSLFRISTSGTVTPLVTFNGGNGSAPVGGVIQALDGNLYGTTGNKGPAGGGTVFEYALAAPPFFVIQPISLTVTNNTTAVFTVAAGGSAPVAYRWVKGTVNVTDSDRISGSTTSTLTIHNVTAGDAGSYTVIISNPYGLLVSSNALLQVTVVRPVLTVSSPKANAKTSNAVVTVTGKASGKLGVAFVYVQLNNSDWTPANTANNWADWTSDISPAAGTNILRVFAVDSEGRASLTNTTKFFHVVSAPIAVHVTAGGSVKPNYDGQELAIGKGYTITARPARGFKFTGWSGSVTSARPALRFIMQQGLEFTASFVDVMRPQNMLLSPRKRQKLTDASVTVTGKARDNAPGVTVWYQLNDADWAVANTANNFTNWTAQVTLTPGTNIIRAYAIDTTGLKSSTNTVPVIYTAPATLQP